MSKSPVRMVQVNSNEGTFSENVKNRAKSPKDLIGKGLAVTVLSSSILSGSPRNQAEIISVEDQRSLNGKLTINDLIANEREKERQREFEMQQESLDFERHVLSDQVLLGHEMRL